MRITWYVHNKCNVTKYKCIHLSFNLKGGGYGFLFRSEFFFRTTQEIEYLFYLSGKARIFFLTLGYMTKTLNQIIFVFFHQKQNIFFSNIGNQNIFLGKNHNPLPPLQVKWSFPQESHDLGSNDCFIKEPSFFSTCLGVDGFNNV
jgi:hypothetical protein